MIDINKININDLDKTITIADIVVMMGGKVADYPVIGKTIIMPSGTRRCQYDVKSGGNIDLSYEFSDTELIRIYIGHKFCGPMLSMRRGGDGGWVWRNLYGNGNHGKNYACGGTWSASSKRSYTTAYSAMQDRDYDVRQPQIH